MSVPELSHDRDRVKTGVLSQSGRNDLKCFGESLETVGFLALERLGVLVEQAGDVDLRRTSTGDEGPAEINHGRKKT